LLCPPPALEVWVDVNFSVPVASRHWI
jgi:hypothetical protein